MAIPLYQAKAEFFRTLGHPVRIRVLELLQDGPRPVRELLTEIEIEPSNLSQQLAVLRRTQLVSATRAPDRHGLKELARYVTFGASPRATINLTEGARALAMLRGRGYALPEDMTDLVPDVLRHRVVLSYEALSEGLTSDMLVQKIMAKIPPPAKPLEHEKLVA